MPTLDSLELEKGRRPAGSPSCRELTESVLSDLTAAQLAGFRELLTSGSIGKRRAFLNAWVRRIEVHGTDLKIVYSFPWFPDGQAAAGEPQGGDVVSLALERDDRKARTTQAEPGMHQVLPMVSNGSPSRAISLRLLGP